MERAFRTIKTSRLKIRPFYVYTEEHVRAHVFLCMPAYHIEWHMRRSLAPLLFEDDDREPARARRNSPVEPARASTGAKAKAGSQRTPDGFPVHSMTTLLADLSTLALNDVAMPAGSHAFTMLTKPTDLQIRAFELLVDNFGSDDDLSAKIKNYHGLVVDYFSVKLGVAGYIHHQSGMRRVL